MALEGERLAAEDGSQLAAIRSSGARIVKAGDAERRRIERDLHDGAQQRLVALLLTARLIAQQDAPPDLLEAEAELQRAVTQLRQLAHGIYPVLLKDTGLHAALHALAESRQLTVSIPHERYPDVVESTAYQLVNRLSTAESTTVQVHRDETHLVLDASMTNWPETDLQDLQDRIQTLGGTLEMSSGTTATLTLPLLNSPTDRGQNNSDNGES